jgi:hypothetical protein
MFRRLSIVGFLVNFLSLTAMAYPNPLCPPTGVANVDQACEWGVRGQEYSLRHWYFEALNKYESAHLFDYSNSTYINQIIANANALSTALNGITFTQADSMFPQLQMATATDQIAKSLYYSSWATAAGTGAQFQSFLSAISSSNWTTRSTAGVQAAANLSPTVLQSFSNLLVLTRLDLQFTVANVLATAPTLPCSVFYPFQFVYSNQAMVTLVSAVGQFANTGCASDVYRAILVQAFLSGGSPVILVDSNFLPIVYASSDPTVESLTNPLGPLSARILDAKFLNAISDSVVAAEHADQNTDISSTDLSTTISGLSGFLSALNVSQANQINFYKGLISYAITQTDIIYLRLAAAYSDQLNSIESGRRK